MLEFRIADSIYKKPVKSKATDKKTPDIPISTFHTEEFIRNIK